MGCGGSKKSAPKATTQEKAQDKTLLDAPAEKQGEPISAKSVDEIKAFISTSSKEDLTAKLVAMSPGTRAKIMSAIQASYKAETVQAAWDNHFGAFGSQDVIKIMLDYTEESELRAFDHRTGKLDSCKGMAQIQKFFEGLFATLKDTSDLAAPTIDVTEDPKQVYLIWSCGASGIVSATDSFIFGSDNKISRQNIAFTSKAQDEVQAEEPKAVEAEVAAPVEEPVVAAKEEPVEEPVEQPKADEPKDDVTEAPLAPASSGKCCF